MEDFHISMIEFKEESRSIREVEKGKRRKGTASIQRRA